MSQPRYLPPQDGNLGPVYGSGEVAASAVEIEAREGVIVGSLVGNPIHVPPVKEWRSSAVSALRNGDMHRWAEITLDDDDWAIWEDVDPTLAQIEDFFEGINDELGTSPGNSRNSRRSSRSTKRR